MSMSDLALSIDEVFGWPVSIRIQIPESEVIIENNWIGYICCYYCFLYIVFYFFKSEFRSMDTDDDESLISILRIPCGEIWERSLTVDTRVCPEVDDDHFSLQTRHRERIGIDPVRE